MNTFFAVTWGAIGLYFVVASIDGGGAVSSAMAMACGFMVARNLSERVTE